MVSTKGEKREIDLVRPKTVFKRFCRLPHLGRMNRFLGQIFGLYNT
jgi:hypothetical protein